MASVMAAVCLFEPKPQSGSDQPTARSAKPSRAQGLECPRKEMKYEEDNEQKNQVNNCQQNAEDGLAA
jgi:hypothetical protein